ncbi:hypothetical protein MNV49_004327 [Pseudohyphozyma bogoriensis]|nr:hypothetical protein MNV49_004327 [Pseudohyphozyma bogoriensis]
MAGSHIELKKRAERNNKRVGTKNPLKSKDEPLEKKRPIKGLLLAVLLFVVVLPVFLEFASQIFSYFYPTAPASSKGRR